MNKDKLVGFERLPSWQDALSRYLAAVGGRYKRAANQLLYRENPDGFVPSGFFPLMSHRFI